MDDLRLILLLIGAGVILGVYAWTRFATGSGKRDQTKAAPVSSSASFSDEPDEQALQQELQRMQQVMSDKEQRAPEPAVSAGEGGNELVVVSVVASQDKPFDGEALEKAFSNNDLRFGDKGIFHRMVHEGGEYVSLYGIANMVKPGDFGNGDLYGFESPGVTLFLQLPGPQDNLTAFDDFVQTAERLAVELGGQLMDHKHCVITHQALMAKRDRIAHAHLKPQIAS